MRFPIFLLAAALSCLPFNARADVPQRIVRARYQHQDVGTPTLGDVIDRWVARSAL